MRQKRRGEGQEEGAQEPRAGFLVGRRAFGNGDLGERHPKGDLGLPICAARIKQNEARALNAFPH